MKEAAKLWYIDPKMVDAVNRCMDVISACGLSTDSAEYLPFCLDQAIKASNQISAQKIPFRAKPVKVENDNGCCDVKPWELLFVQ